MTPYLFFIIGLVILVKGADLLVVNASAIARRFGVSDLVIGLTVVAFGTSLPELFVSVTASISGSPELAIGNVLGSNTANILLILGVSSLIYPLDVGKGTVWKEIPFSVLAIVVLAILANDMFFEGTVSQVSQGDGLILLAFFAIFLYYSASIATSGVSLDENTPKTQRPVILAICLILIALAGLGLGSKWMVDSAVTIAQRLGMPSSVIGLTVVAIGTSLPELATSAVAAYKHNADIAVGNVVGSNIFNIFLILGCSSLFNNLTFYPLSNIDIAVSFIASFILFVSMFTGKRHRLDRWEGGVCLAGYIAYTIFLLFFAPTS